jgi:NAD(P)-dependent dehydrogenase (short-subunit alcohol dehydrogenase family)
LRHSLPLATAARRIYSIRMKILLVGGSGTIGKAVADALARQGHEVVRASRKSEPHVDVEEPATVRALFQKIGDVDAVVSCAGSGAWGPLDQLSDADFAYALKSKLMGQVNLIRIARDHVKDGGSITVTSGILATQPMPGSAVVSLINAGLEGFVRAAGLEMPRGIRVNVVSPPWVKETLRAMKMDEKHGMAAADVAKAYVASVEGQANGEVIPASKFA